MALTLTPGSSVLILGDSITAGYLTGVPWCNEGLTTNYVGRFLHTVSTPSVSARATATFSLAAMTVGPNGAGANYDPVWAPSGVSGNTVADINARAPAVLASFSAVANLVVIVEGGTNDVFDDPAAFRTTVDALIATIKSAHPSAQIGWVNVLCNGEQFPDPLNATIGAVNNQIALAVAASGGTLIDVRAPQQAYEQANNTPSPGAFAGLLTADGIHPVAPGRALMCAATEAVIVLSGNVS